MLWDTTIVAVLVVNGALLYRKKRSEAALQRSEETRARERRWSDYPLQQTEQAVQRSEEARARERREDQARHCSASAQVVCGGADHCGVLWPAAPQTTSPADNLRTPRSPRRTPPQPTCADPRHPADYPQPPADYPADNLRRPAAPGGFTRRQPAPTRSPPADYPQDNLRLPAAPWGRGFVYLGPLGTRPYSLGKH